MTLDSKTVLEVELEVGGVLIVTREIGGDFKFWQCKYTS